MSVVNKLTEHQDELMQEVLNVQDLMDKSATGASMLAASVSVAQTDEMKHLMALLGSPDVDEEERILLSQYMGEMLKRDAANGMGNFADYLRQTAKNPKYAAHAGYYLEIADAAHAVGSSALYGKYIAAYNEFEIDASPEALAAKQASADMQQKMQQWAGK